MANNQQDNRRVKIGAIFLLLLLAANFAVRLGRRSPTTGPTHPIPANSSQEQSEGRVSSSVNLNQPKPSEFSGETTDSFSGSAENTMQEIDLSLEKLKQQLDLYKNALARIKAPLPAPDLNQALFLQRKNIFEYQLPQNLQPVVVLATQTIATPVASAPPPLHLLGVFDLNGRKKVMVRRQNKVFMVIENDMNAEAELSLLSYIDGRYTIIDRQGQEHILSLPEPEKDNVDRIVELLKNPGKQSTYSIIEGATPERIPAKIPAKSP